MICPKCGENNITTRYHEDRAACGYQACDGARYGHAFKSDQPLYAKEHLAQRCDNCLYVWAVATRSPDALSGVSETHRTTEGE